MAQYFVNIFNGIKALVGGMSLTIQHMRKKKELVATMQYPHEKWPLPEKDIGFEHKEYNVIRSRLHVDIDDCIGCLQCERACPVDCIKIDTIKPSKDSDYDCGQTSFGTQKKMIVPRFTIDMSECMYCNLCVYPCPEECIYMVGGPNEDKHPIDYEFSQFERKGLIFEFANSTDQDIIDVGGKDYLDKRNEKVKNLEKGLKLEGEIVEEKPVSKKTSSLSSQASAVSAKPDIKSLNIIEDKMARALAKKAFLGALKESQDIDFIVGAIEKDLADKGKLDDTLKAQLEEIKNTSKAKSQSSGTPVVSSFSIKSFNSVDDKMARGLCKKIYLSGTKKDQDISLIAEEIKSTLEDKKIMSAEVSSIIEEMLSGGNSVANEEKPDLFDMKLLNDIEDKMARGLAKKVYIANKKLSKKTDEVVKEITLELEKNEKLDNNAKEVLKGVLK